MKVFLSLTLLLVFGFVEAQTQIFGVGTHAGQQRISFERASELIENGQFGSFRDEIYWGHVERSAGELQFNRSLNDVLKLVDWGSINAKGLVILNYGNRLYDGGQHPESPAAISGFVNYSNFMSRSLASKVWGYEIWNEWNIGAGKPLPKQRFGDPGSYFKLVQAVAPVVRKNDPQARILCGAVADMDMRWIEKIVELGVLNYCDGLSVHPYNFSEKLYRNDPEAVFDWIDDLYAYLRSKSFKEKQIFITEIGWPTHSGKGGRDAEISGAYHAQTILFVRARPFVGGVWWYELLDGGSSEFDKEQNFGLVRSDFSVKPGFNFHRLISQQLIGARPGELKKLDPLRRSLEFFLEDGSRITALWSRGFTSNKFTIDSSESYSVFYLDSAVSKMIDSPRIVESVGPLPVIVRHHGVLRIR